MRARRTDGVVFEHAHGGCHTRALEVVEEAGHGHGDQPDVDDARFFLGHGDGDDGTNMRDGEGIVGVAIVKVRCWA